MNAQEQQVFKFSQQMNATEQRVESPQQVTSTNTTQIKTSYQEPRVLGRSAHINLSTPIEQLEVLCELPVDFDNLKENGMDLIPELQSQGWITYFNLIYGHIYTNLVKEFWIFTDCDDHYIVSHNLGIKMVITEKSIVTLLNMEKDLGRRIYNINYRAKYMSQEIIPTIFSQNPEERTSSKNQELHKDLKVWLKIILGCIHHRPSSISSDYVNTY